LAADGEQVAALALFVTELLDFAPGFAVDLYLSHDAASRNGVSAAPHHELGLRDGARWNQYFAAASQPPPAAATQALDHRLDLLHGPHLRKDLAELTRLGHRLRSRIAASTERHR